MNKVTDNKFTFNISTPVEKYKELTGRFGFSEEKRHFVAEVKTPSNLIGVELLFFLKNMSYFNVKLQLATPLLFMQNALLLGKLKSHEVMIKNLFICAYCDVKDLRRILDLDGINYKLVLLEYGFIKTLQILNTVTKYILPFLVMKKMVL